MLIICHSGKLRYFNVNSKLVLVRSCKSLKLFKKTLKESMGEEYMKLFSQFDIKPFAAASIGQVHLAILKETNKKVAVKVQYPGVEKSIKSDIDNLMTLLSVANLLPKGLYVENVIKHVKVELFNECDYIREAS